MTTRYDIDHLTEAQFETGDGIKRARIRGSRGVRVDLGAPVFRRRFEAVFRQGGRRVEAAAGSGTW